MADSISSMLLRSSSLLMSFMASRHSYAARRSCEGRGAVGRGWARGKGSAVGLGAYLEFALVLDEEHVLSANLLYFFSQVIHVRSVVCIGLGRPAFLHHGNQFRYKVPV